MTPPKRSSSEGVWSAWCDGASRGNPGPASYGVVLCDPAGAVAGEVAHAIGVNTNQVAEYEALLRVLDECRARGARRVHVYTDSEFVTKQVNGQYKARDERMKVLLSRVREKSLGFDSVLVTHILRSSHPNNVRADKLANLALDTPR